MADKKNIPINAEKEAQNTPAVSLADKLNLAAERMTRVTSGNQDKKAEQARLLKEAEAEAARKRVEADAARLAAEKQAKTVADRKLAEYTYAENYRKKLIKDKEKNISASKARDMQKKADAEARRRAELEKEINELIDSEKREAEERRARQDAALERARAAKEALAESAKQTTAQAEALEMPKAPEMPVADEAAFEMPAAEENAPTYGDTAPVDSGADSSEGGMTLSLPSVTISPAERTSPEESAQPSADQPSFDPNNMSYDDYVRAYSESMAAYEQQMRDAQSAYMAQMGAQAPATAKPGNSPAKAAKSAPAAKGKATSAAEKKTDGTAAVIAAALVKNNLAKETPAKEIAPAQAAPTEEVKPAEAAPAEETIPVQAASAEETTPAQADAPVKEATPTQADAPAEEKPEPMADITETAEKSEPIAENTRATEAVTETKKTKATDDEPIAENTRAADTDTEPTKGEDMAEDEKTEENTDGNDDGINKYLSEIGTLSALVATYDERLRRIEEDKKRRDREDAEAAEGADGAKDATDGVEDADIKDEAGELVDAEQIVVRENKQPVYDEEAIKRDIESMNRRALPGYLRKSDKKLRTLEKQAKRLEGRIGRSTEDDRIEATLIAISVRKDIVDLLCENLKCCALFKVKKHNKYFSKKIRRATAKYNALVAIYESCFNEELTKADPAVVDGILRGEDYTPLPSVTYVKETVKVPAEDTELSSDGETVKVARRITASESKLRKKVAYHADKKNSATSPSQRASQLAECLAAERDIVELYSQGLASSVAADNKKEIRARKKKLDLAVAEYNAYAEELDALVGGEITKAKVTLSDDIIAGEEYTPLPEIKYTLERIEPEKSPKEAKRKRRAALLAARRGEIMPEDERYLGAYITRSDKAALKIERLVKKNDKAKSRLRGEAYNRAILNSAMLHARIAMLDRDCLIAAYRLDAQEYIPARKEKLLSSVQNYNDDITEYDDATGIKLIKISPTLGEDIVSGRSYQVIPELLWRERFVELADISSLTSGDGEVFVFPTLDKVAKEQSTDEGRYVIEAKLGSLPLSIDRPIALPVNTARVFGKLKVDRRSRLRAFDARLKKAEHLIERELSATAKRIAASDAGATVSLLVKRIVLLGEIVNRRIEGLTYAVRFSRKRRAESYKLKIIEAMVRYNAAIDEYNAVADEKFSYADAHIPYAILQDRDYSPMPEIVYRKEFIEKNGNETRVVSTLARTAESANTEAKDPAVAVGAVGAAGVALEVGKDDAATEAKSLEDWNRAAKEQYNSELAESAAMEAKSHSEMAEYMKRLAESYSVSAKNNNESARYYRDLAGDAATKSDNSVKMAAYYASLAEEQRNKAEYIASQASAYERDAKDSVERVRAYAEKAGEAVDIASIAMLDAKDNLERKIGVGIVTATPASYRASVVQTLDDQGLRKYAEKYDRTERIKESRMRGLLKRAGAATGNDKITLTLDALIECKARIDVIVDILRQAVRSDSQRYKKLYSERLRAAISDYNTIADAYTSVTLKPISHIDPAIVSLVLEGKRFAPIPDITYTRGFKAPGDENVVVLKPGITVEEAVSTTTFSSRAELAETISKQLAVDIDSVSKGIEYEIKMLERSENVNQAYRFGFGSKRSLDSAKSKIKSLKKSGMRAVEEQRRDDERYYSVVYANPMTVSLAKGTVKKLGKKATRLEAEHSKKSEMMVREDIARIRENVIALLDERHKINCEVVALYTGCDVDPHGLPVSEKYQEKRMNAARRTYRRLRGKADVVKHLSNVSEATKAHIFALMNKKIVLDSNLELFKYRYKNEKHSRSGRKLILKDIRATQKSIKSLDRDIKGFLSRAIRVHKERKNEAYRGAIMFVLFALLIGTAILAYIFREPLMAYIKNFIGGAFGGVL